MSVEDANAFLDGIVVVEEKLDGANVGISIAPNGALRAQNRGQYLQEKNSGQFSQMSSWIAQHEDALFDGLDAHLIAFGEWCAARHTLDYSRLPDWWLLFDIYDRREQRFWSTARRNLWAAVRGLAVVPNLHEGHADLRQLRAWVSTDESRFRAGGLEGIVVRREDSEWLAKRAKIVRKDFTQAIGDHWRSRVIEWNRLVER